MKTMMLAFAAIAAISVAAYFGLQTVGFSAQERQTSENVRYD